MSIEDIAARFFGVDISYRRGGFDHRGPWRARLITSKNENAEYRVTGYGVTRQQAEDALLTMVDELDDIR